MKTPACCLAILTFVLCSFHALSQKMPGDYFDDGVRAMEQKQYASALQSFQHIAKHNLRNELYPRAIYNIGCVYYAQKSWDSAISIFRRILVSGFNEMEALGGGIMDDPYTNYCHHASEHLYFIYSKQQRYDSALAYLYMSDTLFPYQHFCGNELEANSIRQALQFAKMFGLLHKPDSAIKSLLPVMFYTNFADNSEAMTQLKKLLVRRGDKGLNAKLDKALGGIYSRTIIREKDTSTYYYFRFLDYEFRAPYYKYDGEGNKNEAIESVKGTTFYKMIAELG